MRPSAVLDGCGKSRPHRDSIPEPARPYRVAIPTTLSWLLTINNFKKEKRKHIPENFVFANLKDVLTENLERI